MHTPTSQEIKDLGDSEFALIFRAYLFGDKEAAEILDGMNKAREEFKGGE